MKKAIIFALLYLFSTESFVLKPPTHKEVIKRAYPVAGALFAFPTFHSLTQSSLTLLNFTVIYTNFLIPTLKQPK